ncbi:MAG: START domain-containing protein, partial [Bdellovibrionota bacterium]
KRDIPGSDVLAFKGEGDVDAPLAKLASVIFDTTRGPEWMEDLVESRLVRWVNKNQFIEYDHFKTPPLIKDRDFVSQVTMRIDPKTKQLSFLYKTAEDSEEPEYKRNVRGDLMNSVFYLTSKADDTKTHIVGEIHCDPKGSIPKWLVNFFQKDWPTDTLRGLRKQVAKPDVKVDPRFVEMIQTGR